MQTAIFSYEQNEFRRHPLSSLDNDARADLVLAFGAKSLLASPGSYDRIRSMFPSATIVTCSTAGEIFHSSISEDSISLAALAFDHTRIQSHSLDITGFENSYDAGKALLEKYTGNIPDYLMILSDGSLVNGSELVRGLNDASKKKILITGGLAGDGSDFHSTLAGLNEQPRHGQIIAIGFYGDKLSIGHGSRGGWETFGLQKQITRSVNNVVFEIDGKNALDLYKNYLGSEAAFLPGSALLFPLAAILPGQAEPVVRTILSIDPASGSMTFAGDIPEGSLVRFMKANFDKITYAASEAASDALISKEDPPDFALLISCVGRKLILQSRIEEEIEAVSEVFGHKTILSGFYSYGEISPIAGSAGCMLHNQTMTITTFHEAQ